MNKEIQKLFNLAYIYGKRVNATRIPYPNNVFNIGDKLRYKENLESYIKHPELFYLTKGIPSKK